MDNDSNKHVDICRVTKTMKFKEFVENCNKLLEENPEVAEFDAIYSRDDEGNGYQEVSFTPTIGIREEGWCFEFISIDSLRDEPEEFDYTEHDVNAVCIN
jgi:hypothetical protein